MNDWKIFRFADRFCGRSHGSLCLRLGVTHVAYRRMPLPTSLPLGVPPGTSIVWSASKLACWWIQSVRSHLPTYRGGIDTEIEFFAYYHLIWDIVGRIIDSVVLDELLSLKLDLPIWLGAFEAEDLICQFYWKLELAFHFFAIEGLNI